MPFQGMWNYLVDPSQPDFPGMPSWGGDDPTISGPFLLEEGDVSLEEASTLNDMINAFNEAAGMGVSSMGASSMGASSMPAPDPSSQGVMLLHLEVFKAVYCLEQIIKLLPIF